MPLAFEQKLQHIAHGRIVLDDQYGAAGLCGGWLPAECRHLPGCDVGHGSRAEGDLDAEHGARAQPRANVDRVPEQAGDALDDREPKPEALAALPRRIVELVELLEDRGQLLIGDARVAVPDLDPQHVPARPATQQHFSP